MSTTGTAMLAVSALAAVSSPSQARAAVTPGGRIAMAGARPIWATSAADRGSDRLPSGISARVYLAGRDPQGLRAYAAAASTPGNPLFRHFLTPAQVLARFGPSASQVGASSWRAALISLTVRLYLSSFGLGDHPDRLLTLVREPAGSEVAVIANAMDAVSGAERSAAVRLEARELAGLRLRPSEVDLRLFFDRPSDIGAELSRFPLVWLRGGNVFMLRHALARSGADGALVDLLRRDAIVYAGYSAGACVLAPSLRGLEHCDDPAVVPGSVRWDGLGILDRALVPHIDSPDHPESRILGEVAAAYQAAGVPYLALRDGQAFVIDGTDSQVV